MRAPAALARAMHELIEPINSIAYFVDECTSAWSDLGIDPVALGYFPGRASPLGRVGGPAVAAAFFNFNPELVTAAMDQAWRVTSPEAVLDARNAAMQAALERLDVPPDPVEEATLLLRDAMDGVPFAGRPLAAANAAVPPTGRPLGDLWQAVATAREYRGDGHVALLTAEGLRPVEALVLYTGWQDRISRRFYQLSRAWDDDAWQSALDGLAARGLVHADGQLTAEGQAFRDMLEDRTDEVAAEPWTRFGPDRTRRLWELLHPIADAVNTGFRKPFTIPASFPA